MGAYAFETTVSGPTAADAFNGAVEHAKWEHGHGGYTGTIAEKDGFVDFTPAVKAAGIEPREAVRLAWDYARHDQPNGLTPEVLKLITKMSAVVNDKWGPAACLRLKEPADGQDGQWIFFGYASS